MALVRWEPLRELNTLQHEMNRLFGGFFDQPAGQAGGVLRRQWIPAMDLVETDGGYVLRADLPGLKRDDVKIELEQNVLTISGERDAKHEQRTDHKRRRAGNHPGFVHHYNSRNLWAHYCERVGFAHCKLILRFT